MEKSYYQNSSYPSMVASESWGDIGYLWDNARSRMMDKPWYRDFVEVLRNNGNVEEFIKAKNEKFYYDYMADKAGFAIINKNDNQKKLNKAQDELASYDKRLQLATQFQKMVTPLVEAYPQSKSNDLKRVLQEYLNEGKFNTALVSRLCEQPAGLIDKLKDGRKISAANKLFNQFMDNCQKNDFAQSFMNSPRSVSDILRDVTDLKIKPFSSYQDAIEWDKEPLEKNVKSCQALVGYDDETISFYNKTFHNEIEPRIQKEDEIIHQFVESLRMPPQQDHSDEANRFLGDIKEFNDEETVIFNFQVSPQKRFEQLMQDLGYSIGSSSDKWMCRVNDGDIHQIPEVWSPVMTIKEAKEIMPLIIDKMNEAEINHQAVIMPISTEKLANIKDGGNEVIPQFNFQQSLKEFLSKAKTSEQFYTEEQIKQEFNGNSLFNGSMVSDDYFPWSRRSGRNGVVYAGVDLNYIMQYDGARQNGVSGTTDFYIPTKIGEVEVSGESRPITVGFINVYERAPEVDRFYPNFGMEDNKTTYRGLPEHDSETFATPDKNPLKAKFMHIVGGTQGLGGYEFFYKVPERPDPFVQFILDQRKGDVRNTFNSLSPVLARLYKQADEIGNDVVKGSGKGKSLSDVIKDASQTSYEVKESDKTILPQKKEEKETVLATQEEVMVPTPVVNEVKELKEEKVEEDKKQEKAPKEIVAEKLKAMGIEEGSYMLFTKNEDIYTTFGTGDIRDIKGYFEEGEAEIKRTGKDVVYGTNNSVIGAYFKEGVYVVSQSDKLRDELYHKGRDVGLSAMLSNGESFVYFNKMKNSVLNNKWKDVKDECEKDNIQYIKDYQQRQQRLKEMEERATAQNICGVLENVVNIADKHDKTGLLKKALIHTYICDEERMLKLDFWGKLAQKYATQSPHGQEVTLKDFGKLGLDISKDIKLNQSKEAYREVKKNCAEAKSAEDMIKVAKRCAKVTQKAPLDNTYSAVASR